jgi:voltage-gated potassium channel
MSGQAEGGIRHRLHELYYGQSEVARRFRFALLAFDLCTILFFVVSSMAGLSPAVIGVDLAIALVLLLDYVARMAIANRPWRFALRFTSVMDVVVIASLTVPFLVENLAFLRVARMLRLLRSYHVVADLRRGSPWFRRNEEVIASAVSLAIFVFVITAVVFVVEHGRNPTIGNYFDALYFTVTTLTTTGFGDITMTDMPGRILAVVIMVFGVTLFLRLIQTIFQPPRINFPCPGCGLRRHEPDSVHCRHCGMLLKIPDQRD